MNMGSLRKKKGRLQHPFIPSVIQPVPHSTDMPTPDSPKKLNQAELSDLAKAEGRASGIQTAPMESTPISRQDYRVQDS
ncbi:hypothetical protein TNCT_482941 [Trichonephila clavata]|uniref:Uncharacterized protein n=1 Tax=Trichonephila clavata TaxID=2740835 RepID=A0A8X6L3J5_TRICU|nr:hypothetical protein TNCT_482941 [Trichonephila clavata]